MQVQPLTPTLGAEISGIDVTNMNDGEFDALFRAFTAHSVIFLRDQPALSPEAHRAFAQRFGEIHVHPAARAAPSETRDASGVMNMRTHETSRVAAGNRWHSDVSCDERPPQASILQLHEIPPLGGDTLFASLYAAYDTLSERMKVYLDGVSALHSGEEAFRHTFQFDRGEARARWPEHEHPIARKHADSGRPALFVDREFTKEIVGLPKEEGKALLAFLFEHTERVDFQCRFRWTPNAIAIWDNRCALHHAMWDYWPATRQGRRISVVGERPQPWRLGQDALPETPLNEVRLTL